jgi:DNA-binding MarR family transcriptional regulator
MLRNYGIIVRVMSRDHADGADAPARWTFLTNHAHVLLCIARERDARLRDIADRVGITERAAQGIVTDLADAGYVSRRREGRRNVYEVRLDGHFRHPLEREHQIGALLETLGVNLDQAPTA